MRNSCIVNQAECEAIDAFCELVELSTRQNCKFYLVGAFSDHIDIMLSASSPPAVEVYTERYFQLPYPVGPTFEPSRYNAYTQCAESAILISEGRLYYNAYCQIVPPVGFQYKMVTTSKADHEKYQTQTLQHFLSFYDDLTIQKFSQELKISRGNLEKSFPELRILHD